MVVVVGASVVVVVVGATVVVVVVVGASVVVVVVGATVVVVVVGATVVVVVVGVTVVVVVVEGLQGPLFTIIIFPLIRLIVPVIAQTVTESPPSEIVTCIVFNVPQS